MNGPRNVLKYTRKDEEAYLSQGGQSNLGEKQSETSQLVVSRLWQTVLQARPKKHAHGRWTVKSHLESKSRSVLELYKRFVELVGESGPFEYLLESPRSDSG